MTYLEFEKPIEELYEQLEKVKQVAEKSGVDISQMSEDLHQKIKQARADIYGNLSPWQRVQVSRHPDRPYTLAYIDYVTDIALHEMQYPYPNRKATRFIDHRISLQTQ